MWITMFLAPVIEVVPDAGLFVRGHLVSVHNPPDRGPAIDFILLGFLRDTADANALIVDDGGFVLYLAFLSIPNLRHLEMTVSVPLRGLRFVT